MKKSVLQLIVMLLALLAFQGCNKTKDNTPAPATPAPTITVFAPASGVAGTVVTITGTNFGATTDKNAVTFAGTPATVTAATTSLLTVTVPQGAATGKITITVGNNVVSSATDFTVFGSPTITSFTPASALPGATVVITGTNFDATAANNVVKFNGVAATVTQASATQLTVTVPATVTNGKITVVVNGLTATSATDFTVPPPTITSFTPLNGIISATVTITGTNFSTTAANNVVKFNGIVTTVTQATATQLTVTVPVGASTGKISVGSVISAVDFTVILPVSITSLSAVSGAVGKTIVITGENFEAIAANNLVKFNLTPAVVTAATTTQLTVEVPYGTSTGPLSVKVSNGSTAEKFFNIVSAWTLKTDCPMDLGLATSFVIGNKGYLGGGISGAGGQLNSIVYEFDPTGNGTWTPKQSAPAGINIWMTGFSIADKGYAIAFQTRDIFRYVPGTDTWTNIINTAPAYYGQGYVSTFALGNKGYIKDDGNNVVEFDPAANGGNGSVTPVQAYPGAPVFTTAFVIGGTAYMGGGILNGPSSKFYKYTGGTWTALGDLPVGGKMGSFSIGQYGYLIQNGQVWRYNPATDSWTQLEDFSFSGASLRPAFSIGQKGYVATGGIDSGGVHATGETWEYDPSK